MITLPNHVNQFAGKPNPRGLAPASQQTVIDRYHQRPETPSDEPSRNPQALREQREQAAEIRRLKARDGVVRAHEQAHKTVGGQYAGNAKLTYERGPDGILYATGGEVPIDVSVVPGDPQATLRKMQVVRRAAMAPVNPSAADRAIAVKASARASRASAEIAAVQSAERQTRGTNIDLLA